MAVRTQGGRWQNRGYPAAVWFVLAIAVVSVLFLFLGWHIYESHRILQDLTDEFAGEVTLVTEVQTLRSDLGQEVHHIVRYGATESRLGIYESLSQRLQERFQAVDSEGEAGPLRSLRRLSRVIDGLERQAIGSAEQGRPDEGEKLLHSPGYLDVTRMLGETLRRILEAVSADFQQRLQDHRRNEAVSLSIDLAIFLFSIVLWWVLAARLRQWREQREVELGRRLEAEAQLRQAQKMDALGQMAAGVAHDFNNVLTAILGYADLVARAADKGLVDRAGMSGIQAAAEQGTAVTRALLTFSHRSGTDSEQLSLCDLVNESVGLLRKTLPANIEVRTHLETTGGNCRILGNRNQLQQILLNLALNARDAMPEGGRLEIGLTLDNGDRPIETGGRGPARWIRLSVSDTGDGIPGEIREHVFDPFFTTKPRGKSTGLGLAVVQGIAIDHDAEIELDSRPGEGTTISIRFPLSQGAPRSPVKHGLAPATRVLIGSGDGYQAQIMASIIARQGFAVETAPDWQALLERIQRPAHSAPVVVLDAGLPGCESAGCRQALSRAAGAPAVILLTDKQAASIPAYQEAGFLVLERPFPVMELIRLVVGQSAAR